MKLGASHKNGSLLSPAGVVAMFALVVSLSGTAWAAATITGADIKDGTVTTRDIKNDNLQMKDMAGSVRRSIRDSGARAVAVVYSDGTNCYVDTAKSRGFLSTCDQTGTGQYSLTPRATVNIGHTTALCAMVTNGGTNTTYDRECDAQIYSGKVRIVASRSNATSPGTRENFDPNQSLPLVVMIP